MNTTDDQWWKQQDEEAQQAELKDMYVTFSASDRAKALRLEAMNACEGDIAQAMGWLSMALALHEQKLSMDDRDKEIDHLKKVIKILERKS